jgi:nucleotide-binding universal stress UspA family protein
LADPLQSVEQAMSTPIPRHILVPHDFSDTAQNALSFAIELATKLGAKITILHAYEVPSYGYPDGVTLTAEVADSIRKAAETALESVVARARRPGLEVASTLQQGSAWREINTAARELHAGLVVMGTHGRHGLARALLGSVAEKVVRTAPCPVLTVHTPETSR